MRPMVLTTTIVCAVVALAGCPDDTPPATTSDAADAAVSTDAGVDAGSQPDANDDVAQPQPDASVDVTQPQPDATEDVGQPQPDAIEDVGQPQPDAGITPPIGETFSVTGGPYSVEPGVENTVCVTKQLSNPTAARVRAIRTTLSAGSHHMIITKVPAFSQTDVVTPCQPFDAGMGSDVLFIAEQPQAELVYPEGAALEIEANQKLSIEVHYLNYLPETIDVTGLVELELIEPDGAATEPVQFFFNGDFGLFLPAQQTTTHTTLMPMPADARIFGMTSHMHRLGVKATIHRATSSGEPLELLHESTDWADPPLTQFDPPITLGGDMLLLTCEWFNYTEQAVTFGLSANDEMCFLWAHWF